MNQTGRAYVMYRLSCCGTLEALKTVWESLGREYQADKRVARHKDALKEILQD